MRSKVANGHFDSFLVLTALIFLVHFFFYYQGCSGRFFEKYHDLPTKNALDVEHFIIDGSLFLAFVRNEDSVIYKMTDDLSGKFLLNQTTGIRGGRDIEYFTIGDNHFLVVADNVQVKSVIYQWNGEQFFISQKIPQARASNFFKVSSEFYLAVTSRTSAIVNIWKDNQFIMFQEITTGAYGSAAFTINDEYFLVFSQNTESPVFKWSGESFVKLQSLKTIAALDVKSFSINGGTFLAFANSRHGDNYNIDSFVYKWNGTAFALFQSIQTHGADAWHPFVICGQTYLGVANFCDGQGFNTKSLIYKFSGSQFVTYQEFSTRGATGMTSFVYKGHIYVVISNHNGNSTVYKWV